MATIKSRIWNFPRKRENGIYTFVECPAFGIEHLVFFAYNRADEQLIQLLFHLNIFDAIYGLIGFSLYLFILGNAR